MPSARPERPLAHSVTVSRNTLCYNVTHCVTIFASFVGGTGGHRNGRSGRRHRYPTTPWGRPTRGYARLRHFLFRTAPTNSEKLTLSAEDSQTFLWASHIACGGTRRPLAAAIGAARWRSGPEITVSGRGLPTVPCAAPCEVRATPRRPTIGALKWPRQPTGAAGPLWRALP